MESLLYMIMDKVRVRMRLYLYPIHLWKCGGGGGGSDDIFTTRAKRQRIYNDHLQIMILPKLEDAETRVNNLKAIREFREGVQKLQNDLSRPFPFIPEIDTRNFASTEPGKLYIYIYNTYSCVMNPYV